MSRTIDIVLGGRLYTVPGFNLRQLREIAKMNTDAMAREDVPFAILAMALKRATPPVESEDALMEIEPEPGEFEEAMQKVMAAAGLQQRKAGVTIEGEAAAPAAD